MLPCDASLTGPYWNSTGRQAVTGEIPGQLDEAGVKYAVIEAEAGELVCLPENVTGG